MRNRKLALGAIVLVIAALAAVLALGTSPGSAKSTAAFKAAWIYVGPHNDGGWSQAHDQGRLYVQKMLGSKVQTTYKENVPEGPQVAQVIEQLVRDGNKIIFATSFGYQNAMVGRGEEVPGRQVRDGDRDDQSSRTWPSTTARVRTRSTSPASPPARRRRAASSATSSRSRSPR